MGHFVGSRPSSGKRNYTKSKCSSAAEHIGAPPRIVLLDNIRFADLAHKLDCKAFLLNDENETETMNVRHATNRDRALASDTSLSQLQRLLNRRLRPLPPDDQKMKNR